VCVAVCVEMYVAAVLCPAATLWLLVCTECDAVCVAVCVEMYIAIAVCPAATLWLLVCM